MSNPTNLLSCIQKQVYALAVEVESSKWELNPQGIEHAMVRVACQSGTAQGLTYLLKQSNVDEAARKILLKTLSKIEKKIALTHKSIARIASGSKDTDPRIGKILAKLSSELTQITPQKIRQYFYGLEQFIEFNYQHEISEKNPQDSNVQLAHNALWELNSKRLQLLTSTPDYDVCDVSLAHLIENCGFYVSEDIQRKGKELTLIHFFEKMLDPRCVSQPHSPHFIHDLISDAYRQACINFQAGDTQDFPVLRCIDESPEESDDEIDLPTDAWNTRLARYEKENLVNLSLKSQYQDIEELFLLMDASRVKADLKGIGVLITLGDYNRLAMIIQNLNSIVIFNPEGDKERHGCPYLVSFGDVRQAAKFLHTKIVGSNENSEIELTDGNLFTLAYRSELQLTVDKNQAKLDEMQPDQEVPKQSDEVIINELIQSLLAIQRLGTEPVAQPEEVVINEPVPSSSPVEPVAQPEEVVINEPIPSLWDVQKQAIDCLQKAIDALSSQSEEGIAIALAELAAYPGKQNLLDPISSRLLQFQEAALRSQISAKGDINSWGITAFQSDEIPSDQKLRAVQRVQMSFLLLSLKLCLQSPDFESHLSEILKLMEDLKLNPADLPPEQANFAHYLFLMTYYTYHGEWQGNQHMIHPHDDLFEGDFGRNAYLGNEKQRGAVPNAYKLATVEKVQNSLKDVWRD